jgi:hypothetical protein
MPTTRPRRKPVTILYHLTDESRLPSILRDGLDPRKTEGASELVYFASDKHTAIGYAGHHGDRISKPVLLSVEVRSLWSCDLGPDDCDFPDALGSERLERGRPWYQYSWRESLRICGQCAYSSVVPPKHIRVESDAVLRFRLADQAAA